MVQIPFDLTDGFITKAQSDFYDGSRPADLDKRAKEKREELIIAANGKVPDAEHSDLVSSTQSLVSLSSNEVTHTESETSADELALDVGTFTSSSHRTPVRAQMNLPRVNNPRKRLKSTRGLAGDLKPRKSSIENPGSRAKRHICGNDGVRKLVYQHNPLQLSCITDNTDSATARDGVHSRFRRSQGCALVCNTTKGSDGGDRRRHEVLSMVPSLPGRLVMSSPC